jgi:hypothetical protein
MYRLFYGENVSYFSSDGINFEAVQMNKVISDNSYPVRNREQEMM